MIKIMLCCKQVPKNSNVEFDENNNLIRENLRMEMNLHDKYALELALSIKDSIDTSIDIITMGLPQTEEMLKKTMPYGLDNGYILTDRVFGGADTLATSYTLAKGIEHIGKYDIILCGTLSSDGATGQVGPQLAEHLNMNLISSVSELKIIDGKIEAIRENGKYKEKISAKLPSVVTVNTLGAPLRKIENINDVEISDEKIHFLSHDNFSIDIDKTGFKGSCTVVGNSYQPKKPEKALMIEEDTMEKSVEKLFDILNENNITI